MVGIGTLQIYKVISKMFTNWRVTFLFQKKKHFYHCLIHCEQTKNGKGLGFESHSSNMHVDLFKALSIQE